jgi:hypothetical protein
MRPSCVTPPGNTSAACRASSADFDVRRRYASMMGECAELNVQIAPGLIALVGETLVSTTFYITGRRQ